MAVRAEEWLRSADATGLFRQPGPATASAAGEHSCRTARMGLDPTSSATDPFGRPWGARRIVVCDSSLHATNGSVNPTPDDRGERVASRGTPGLSVARDRRGSDRLTRGKRCPDAGGAHLQ